MSNADVPVNKTVSVLTRMDGRKKKEDTHHTIRATPSMQSFRLQPKDPRVRATLHVFRYPCARNGGLATEFPEPKAEVSRQMTLLL